MKYLIVSAMIFAGCTANVQDQNTKAIYVNQLGFAPTDPKIAMAHSDSDRPLTWNLIDGTGQIISSGQTMPLGYSPQADQSLHRIVFSDVETAGKRYRLKIGNAVSPDFDITTDLYAPMAKDAMAYFYHNRAGEPILAKHVGASHARPAGHLGEVVTCFTGTDNWGTDWPGCNYELDVTGGWYDAGDHGKYVVNSGISVWTLLNTYERNPDYFADNSLTIPESGNDVPDILDEARHNIELMLSMQVPQGEKVWVAVGQQDTDQPLTLTQIDGGGLVHHKVHDIKWAGDGIRPDENKQTRYLYPPSTGATLNVAAIGAQCARVWREIDPVFARQCEAAAMLAWKAASDNPEIFGYNNFDGGGPYGDRDFKDEIIWTLSEFNLIKSSKISPQLFEEGFATPSFNRTKGLGLLSAVVAEQIKPLSEREEYDSAKYNLVIVKYVQEQADAYLSDINREPLYIPYYAEAYRWGSNSNLANRAIVLGTAYDLTGERKYRDGVLHLMDYMLGRNPLGQSYISGYGDKQYFNPHHRHWAPSVRDGAPTVPAGVLSGGPNNDNMSDPIAKTQVGTCAAQTCWTDDYKAWTQNEITINWNAPLVWMATFLDDTESTE